MHQYYISIVKVIASTRRDFKAGSPKIVKGYHRVGNRKKMVDKVKKNIKCLDTSINTAHDYFTFYSFVLFSTLAAIAKYAAVATAQAHISQAKAIAQARTSFLTNTIL